jgi:hypothetical protein
LRPHGIVLVRCKLVIAVARVVEQSKPDEKSGAPLVVELNLGVRVRPDHLRRQAGLNVEVGLSIATDGIQIGVYLNRPRILGAFGMLFGQVRPVRFMYEGAIPATSAEFTHFASPPK